MSEMTEGRVYTERHDHILKIVIDNVAKKNAFSPEMMAQLSDALTLLENDADLWVGVLCAAATPLRPVSTCRNFSVPRPR